MNEDKKVKVTVAYTGHDEYAESFAAEVPVGTIKRKSLHTFQIEENAADQYAMQFGGTNIDDKTKIGELGRGEIKLTLVLKKPQEKGHGR